MISKFTECPKCNSNDISEDGCKSCGVIFSKYINRKTVEFTRCIENIKTLQNAPFLLSEFADKYPEEKENLLKVSKKIAISIQHLNDGNRREAKGILEDLLKTESEFFPIVVKELNKISIEDENTDVFQEAINKLKEDCLEDASKLLDRAELAGYSKDQLQPYRNELSKRMVDRIRERQRNESSSSDSSDNLMTCPNCGCKSPNLIKEGYKAGRGIVGAIVFGPVGALLGAVNSNKLYHVCPRCGNKWQASF